MAPIFNRCHTLQSFLAPDVVIPVNILIDFPGQIGNGGKVLTVIHLRFQVAKEIFHHRVIETLTG